jgi:hypothetical protein
MSNREREARASLSRCQLLKTNQTYRFSKSGRVCGALADWRPTRCVTQLARGEIIFIERAHSAKKAAIAFPM